MRTRQPFFGDPEDAALLPELQERERALLRSELEAVLGPPPVELYAETPSVHPDYCEKGTELPLGFIPHRGANRRERRASVANFEAEGADRRELWQQRQRQRRGKLDPELRRLQRRKAQSK